MTQAAAGVTQHPLFAPPNVRRVAARVTEPEPRTPWRIVTTERVVLVTECDAFVAMLFDAGRVAFAETDDGT